MEARKKERIFEAGLTPRKAAQLAAASAFAPAALALLFSQVVKPK